MDEVCTTDWSFLSTSRQITEGEWTKSSASRQSGCRAYVSPYPNSTSKSIFVSPWLGVRYNELLILGDEVLRWSRHELISGSQYRDGLAAQHAKNMAEIVEAQGRYGVTSANNRDPMIYPGLYAPSGFDMMSILVSLLDLSNW